MNLNRREFLASAGALVVSFSIPLPAAAQAANPKLDLLDAWLAVGGDGKVTVFCGKVELGTGIQTSLAQIVADELDVAFNRVHMIMGDTSLCQNQGPTVGSQSIPIGGPQLRQAAAEARHTLVGMAAGRLGVPAEQLSVSDGVVTATGGAKVSYGELLGNRRFERKLERKVKPKAPSALKVVGQSVPRVDLPGKVFGTHAYVQNLRLPGMVHGRVIRPPRQQAVVARVDEASLKALPGNVRVARKGNFVAVVADREEQAIAAARALKVEWSSAAVLPDMKDLPAAVKATPAADRELAASGNVEGGMAGAAKTLQAQYFLPFQLHASIGPSCALADVRPDGVTLWSPTQSSFNLRDSVATLLGRPASQVRLIWVEGSGCYGQNGADDVTAAGGETRARAVDAPGRERP
jgi:nicotinate dehydrogenase subunit B